MPSTSTCTTPTRAAARGFMEELVRKLLAEVKLRNAYRIYQDGSGYVVESEDKHGRIYQERVSRETVTYLHDACRGRVVTKEEAADRLERGATSLRLPYTYGFKLQFYTQNVLLVLVALGDAHMEKNGRAYHYEVV